MKTKIFLGSVIAILLAVIGLMIGFNWDIVTAKLKKEEIYTSKDGILQKIDNKELMENAWEINPEVEEGHYAKMLLKFTTDKDAEFTIIYDSKEEGLALNYEVINGVVYLYKTPFNVWALLIKENNKISFYNFENLYIMEKQVTSSQNTLGV